MSRPKLQLWSVWIRNHRGPQELSVSKSEGRAELAPSFIGLGTAGPAPHMTLQQESCAPPHTHTQEGWPHPLPWVWESRPGCMGIAELATPRLRGVVPAAWTDYE